MQPVPIPTPPPIAASAANAANAGASGTIPSNGTDPDTANRASQTIALALVVLIPLLLFTPHLIALFMPATLRPVADAIAWTGAGLSALLVLIYALRHYGFAMHRLFFEQHLPYLDVATAHWPAVTVLIMAHNESKVIQGSLRALLASDYPADRLTLSPVNDRSTDNTGELIDAIANEFPGRIRALHRTVGEGGKPAALAWACGQVPDDIIVIFDADYLPGKGLLKQLVSPFFDPEVGATMGRVVPVNARSNLLTRTLALERSAGYQISQQARQNLGLTAQFGGTVGAIRRRALDQVGGWTISCLAEDTDLTIRLRCAGWHVVYQNRAECYEEVPEEWSARVRQLSRWTQGHHHVFLRHWKSVLKTPRLRTAERIDALLLLGIFLLAPFILIGWSACLYLYFNGEQRMPGTLLACLSLMAWSGLGNFSTFFEIAASGLLDRSRSSLLILPFMVLNFMVSAIVMSRGVMRQSWNSLFDRTAAWAKTPRYRKQEKPTPSRNHLS